MILGRFRRRPAPVVLQAALRDAGDLALIHKSGFERGWGRAEFERLLAERTVVAHVTRAGGQGAATGFVLSRLVADEAEILTIAVAKRWRGAGHGRALLRLHLARLAALGVRSLFLEVAEDNGPAVGLYRSLGFEEVGRRAGYYARAGAKPATALVMRRDLSG
jgi:[ribosomal protein S18]-alanine N-acetyltransferase